MRDDLIAVRDVAAKHGKRKQTVFKVLKRLGIETTKQRAPTGKNQVVAYISQQDCQRVIAELLLISPGADPDERGPGQVEGNSSAEVGAFYLIQLEPEFDPKRFKVGFALSLRERLRHLRCSAPFAAVVKSWPCQRLWEKTAIDCASADCERLHTEVFRAASLDDVVGRCERFFAVMPRVRAGSPELASHQSSPISSPAGQSTIQS